MKSTFPQIAIHELDAVTGGKKRGDSCPTPQGSDGASIAQHDQRFPPLEPELEGQCKGSG